MCALKATVLAAVKTAEEAVGDLKMAAKHVRRVIPEYIPGQDLEPVETLTDVNVVMTRFQTKEIDNNRVMASDWKGLVFPGDDTPDFQTNDLIRFLEDSDDFSAGDYRVIDDDKITVGSKVALHQLHLRLT